MNTCDHCVFVEAAAIALGGAECTARGMRYSDYESAAGTGQVHIWFDTLTDATVRA